MNEMAALRRIALSSSATCARLTRAGGTDAGILAVLANKSALIAAIASASRITISDVDRLSAPLITSNEPNATTEPTAADVEHVRFMNMHG